jgi:hypothetical protein
VASHSGDWFAHASNPTNAVTSLDQDEMTAWTRRSIAVTVRRLLLASDNAEERPHGGRRCSGVVGAVRDYRADHIALQVSDRSGPLPCTSPGSEPRPAARSRHEFDKSGDRGGRRLRNALGAKSGPVADDRFDGLQAADRAIGLATKRSFRWAPCALPCRTCGIAQTRYSAATIADS